LVILRKARGRNDEWRPQRAAGFAIVYGDGPPLVKPRGGRPLGLGDDQP